MPPRSGIALMRRSGSGQSYRVAVGLGLTVLFAATARADDKPGCKAAAIGAGEVRTVIDGRTVQLSDGRQLRLAGIEVPESDAAKAALQSLVSGREISLLRLGPERDRYGRVVAL